MWKTFINIKPLGKTYNEALYSDVALFTPPSRKKNVRILHFISSELRQSACLVGGIVFAIDFRFVYGPCFVKTYHCSSPSKTLLLSAIETTDKS